MITTQINSAGATLSELRSIMDQIEELNKQLKPLTDRKGELHAALIKMAQDLGTDRFGNDDLSVTINDKSVARIDPEQWEKVFKWAVETSNTQILYRQVSAGRIEELALDGVVLPDGLALETIATVNARRK